MNCRRRKSAPTPTPNAHKKKESKRKAGSMAEYGDKHGMERHPMPQPPKEKSGSIAKWS